MSDKNLRRSKKTGGKKVEIGPGNYKFRCIPESINQASNLKVDYPLSLNEF